MMVDYTGGVQLHDLHLIASAEVWRATCQMPRTMADCKANCNAVDWPLSESLLSTQMYV